MTGYLCKRLLPMTALILMVSATMRAQAPKPRTAFRIKYIADGVVYIDGGRAAGLSEKMKLSVRGEAASASKEPSTVIAELEVISVAEVSAACEIKNSIGDLHPGDIALLSMQDAQTNQILNAAGGGNRYAQTIEFTEGDPLDEEVRETLPRPPLPEVNRIRGRLGFEYNGIWTQGGSGPSSSEIGLVMRTDMTRINGTYWNLSGYTRLLLNSTASSSQPTLNDLLNRTYHMALTYTNPQSNWTAGFGRFYLPWAPSLSTIDGGYVGRKFGDTVTAGMFAGTTPDPTSWNYNPNREMAGTFINFAGGSYEGLKYSSTEGLAMTRLSWKPEREFVFLENTLSLKRSLNVYQDLEVDQSHPTTQQPTASGTGIARSFLTLRYQPASFISFDLNHNYFRDYPTFDPRLVGTGLLDKFLFQGLSEGVELTLPYRMNIYTNVGKSNGTGDPKTSWNQMYGIAISNVGGTGIRTDMHYSHFDSSYARGNYESLSLSREVLNSLRLGLQAGQQTFISPVTSQTRARFVNGNLDWSFAARYFLDFGVTVYRGQSQNYTQTFFTLGYRFGR